MELNFEVVREFGVCRGGVMEIREIKETYEMNGMIYYPTNLFLRIARSLLEGILLLVYELSFRKL